MIKIETYVIRESITVKRFLLERLQLSRRRITALKEDGCLTVNGVPRTVRHLLQEGDTLTLRFTEKNSFLLPESGDLNILAENEDYLILEKPCGMPVHPSKGHPTGTVGNFLQYRYELQGKDFSLHLITRLDKDTSGLVLIALNSHSAQKLNDSVKAGEIQKTYYAVVDGSFPFSGRISLPIERQGETFFRTVSPQGKRAETEFCFCGENNGKTLLKITLLTGRTHQIRVHFSFLGHPLVGDPLYGKSEAGRLMLHMHSLAFRDPMDGHSVSVVSPVPKEFTDLFPNVL